MRVAICQLNPTVGALEGNVDKILSALRRAADLGAELAVLPELVIPGYPPLDLLERSTFVDACLEAEAQVARQIPSGLTAIFGNLRRRPPDRAEGRPLQNAATVARQGEILARFAKTLLPTYDVFDEARWFEPRQEDDPAIVELAGTRVGVTICEDLWNDEVLWRTEDLWRDDSPGAARVYAKDPAADLARSGAQLIVNLSASPWSQGKLAVRERIVTHLSGRHGLPCVYANMVGGNDGLVFDGHSLAATPGGTLVHRSVGWSEAVDLVDLEVKKAGLAPVGDTIEEVREALVLGIRDYFEKSGIGRAVIGLSGGIDSAVTCALAVRALGSSRVIGVGMPSRISSSHSVEDARTLSRNLGIPFHVVPIGDTFDAFEAMLAPVFEDRPKDVTEENLQSRIRGTTLMAVANKLGAVVLGTGNKSEASMGYATLYGDTIGALSVLADLYKHQVYALAHLENRDREVIPRSTIEKAPSAELRPGQKDSDTLPDYAVLDAVLERFIERRMAIPDIAREVEVEEALVRDIVGKVYFNEFKRKQLPPTIRVCRKAWVGRVYPIVQRFRA